MRNFNAIQSELDLVRFIASENGDLYVPRAVDGSRLLVRWFNRSLRASLVGTYVRLLATAQAWIERDQRLSSLVRVEQPIEAGDDFLARPFHSATPLANFLDADPENDPPEAPEELATMQARFRELADRAAPALESTIVGVLARSLLEPTYKTVYSSREERFVAMDLKPTARELEQLEARLENETSFPD